MTLSPFQLTTVNALMCAISQPFNPNTLFTLIKQDKSLSHQAKGYQYIIIAYDFDSNNNVLRPIKNRSTAELTSSANFIATILHYTVVQSRVTNFQEIWGFTQQQAGKDGG